MTFSLDSLSDRAKKLTAILALILMVTPAFWWLVGDQVREVTLNLTKPTVAKCVTIPASGHVIEPAPAGEWATITWVGVERHADCGRPQVYGVISNGDEIMHDAKLSVVGVSHRIGVHNIRYSFLVPEGAKAGRAWLMVMVTYPDAGQSVNTPRVPFVIPEGDE